MEAKVAEGLVQCRPKPFPMKHFALIWVTLNAEQRQPYLNNADNKAKRLLQKPKKRNGVAILGQPWMCLPEDPEFQDELLQQAVANGEDLARAALSA